MRNIDAIIPVHNRAKILSEILPTYYNQPEAHAVFVVDDASDEDIKKVVDEAQAHSPVPIRYHRFEKRMGQPASGINFGVAESDQPYVFIGEDDLWLGPDYFSKLRSALEEKGADIAGGRRVYIHDGESQEQALEASRADTRPIFNFVPFEAYFERYTDVATEVPYLHSNSLMRRDVFSSAQFDPGYRNAFRVELDFYLQCLRAKKKMWLIPDATCFHLKSLRKRGTGTQIPRLGYERYVWTNTIQCFRKNADVLRAHWGVKHPTLFAVRCLFSRYGYGFQNRLIRRKLFKYEKFGQR